MVEFDSKLHKYTEDGKDYPSVTQILKDCGLIDVSWYTEDSALKGTYIHDVLREIDEGALPLMLDISEDIAGYIDAYLRFKKENDYRIEAIEKPLINKTLELAGTPDRIATLNRKACIIDIKTGGKERWHGVQLSGYLMLIDSGDYELFGLYLSKDGKYRLETYRGKDFRGIFMSCLNLYHWKRQ